MTMKVGVLIFSRKRPGFDQEWSREIRERAIAAMKGCGFQCIGADRIVNDDQTVNTAMDEIEAAQCNALVVIQPSIADGQFAFTVSQRWSDPVILWGTPERPGDGKVSSCALVGQHLWASIYRQAQRPFEFVYGAPEEIADSLKRAVALCATVQRLRRAKLGVIGTHVPGFIDLAADPFLIRQTFGLQMHSLSLPQFIDRVREIAEDRVAEDLKIARALKLPITGGKDAAPDEMLEMNSRFYLAMKDLMAEMSLQGLALQCWPELPNMLGHWPYLAVSRLTAEGTPVSIEGDVDGALSGLVTSLLGIGIGFLTDWLEHDDETAFFWHPGMAPLDMCNAVGCEQGPSLGEHFNGARPSVVDGELQTGSPVTISRLWRCDNRYHLAALEGDAIPPRRHVSGNSLLVQVDGGDVYARFERLLHAGLPHHVTLHYGRNADVLQRFARLLKLDWHG
ncbi:MAG: L-fucose/L-arabinose isomerase family protein [Acidobacteria bacterium]|nr:L-fucose/L-arabinose isomerase family protein [Acidobacteriota bacterium]